MKKKTVFRIATTILLIPFILVIGFIIIGCVYSSMIPKDSIIVGFEGMEWNGKTYSYIDGEYTFGREIARGKDDEYGWYIREIKEDPSHNFVVACSFLDHRFFVADDYNIPTSGEITTVSWGFRKYITDREFLNAISEIDSQKITTFDYETEAIFVITDNQRMKEIYFAYENCPVPTNNKGYMGKIDDKWVITTYISPEQKNVDGSRKKHLVGCYSIPDKYSSILEKYFE